MLVFRCLLLLAVAVCTAAEAEVVSSASLTEDHFRKMTVKKLRTFISERGADGSLFTEKHEFIQMAMEVKHKDPLPAPTSEEKKSVKKGSADRKKGSNGPVDKDAAEKLSQFQNGDFSPNGDGASAGTSSWTNPLDEKNGKEKESKKESKKPDRKEKKAKAAKDTKETKGSKESKASFKGEKKSEKKEDKKKRKPLSTDNVDADKMDDLQELLRQQGMNAKMFSAKDFEGMDADEMAAKFGGGGGGFGGDGPSGGSGSGSSFKKRSGRKTARPERPQKEPDLADNSRRQTEHVDADVIEL